MRKRKETTLDSLAGMVKRGFDGVDTRFDGVDTRLDKVELRLDRVEVRLGKIEKLIIADHRRRIEQLENSVRELKELLNIK